MVLVWTPIICAFLILDKRGAMTRVVHVLYSLEGMNKTKHPWIVKIQGRGAENWVAQLTRLRRTVCRMPPLRK